MRSRTSHNISSGQVHQWALAWLSQGLQLKDHGWKCTAAVVLSIVLRAAARMSSIHAACRDLRHAPSDQAVFNALADGLPKTLKTLEGRLHQALTDAIPKRLCRATWTIAIDWHLVPYYGQPLRSKNELYYGKPTRGTTKFHAYASACVVVRGVRYTIALTWVRRHEDTVTALKRVLAQIRGKGLKIKRLLLDRAFFNVPVTQFLQAENIPFLMPVVFRGRPPRKGGRVTGLRWIKRQKVGWYPHTLKNGKREVKLSVCVAYRTHKNREDGKRKQQKLLFGGWKTKGSPQEIRQLYRRRFGIESSYRQWRQARISTCTRDPCQRLLFVAVGLPLRKVWVWIHDVFLSVGTDANREMRLEELRFRRMLDCGRGRGRRSTARWLSTLRRMNSN